MKSSLDFEAQAENQRGKDRVKETARRGLNITDCVWKNFSMIVDYLRILGPFTDL